MKKIISLLSVFAMVLTMFSTVTFADNNSLNWEVASKDATSIELNLVLDTTAQYVGGKVNFTFEGLNTDASIVASKGTVGNFGYKKTKNNIGWSFGATDPVTGKQTLGNVKISNVTAETFTIKVSTPLELSDPDRATIDVSGFTYGDTYEYVVKMVEESADPVFSATANGENVTEGAEDAVAAAGIALYENVNDDEPVGYQFDCVVYNCGADFSMKFDSKGQTMTRKFTDLEEVGEAGLEFTALVLNAPDVVTLTSIAN